MAGIKKIAGGFFGVGVVGIVGIVATANMRWDREREAPLPDIHASDDPEVIARGEHLVWGPAHCAGCHGEVDKLEDYEANSQRIPLTGGFVMPIPPGTIRVPNITQDEETGIGKMTDQEIARSLRHGVKRDGRMLFPIMPFANLSDDDLTAIISYLRTIEPVSHEVEPTELTLLGKILFSFVLDPAGPTEDVPKSVEAAPTAEYGRYLAHNVANCNGCHTNRDLATGEFIGEPFGGGLQLEHRGKTYTIPNITPGGEGSKTKGWDEAGFIARIRTGEPSAPGSPMPWAPFSQLDDVELKAIWAYLQTVTPVNADHGPPLPLDG
jgi:mono/diheme cytochrome c family protein